jgi:hypothetical protein
MGDILAIVFPLVLWWALRRVLGGVREGLSGRQPTRHPDRGVQMERDPVCGTFVVPSSDLSIVDGRRRLYFCSAACRDAYRARPSTNSGRPDLSTSSGSPRAHTRGEQAAGRSA